MSLNTEQIQTFRKDGFVAVDNVFDPSELEALSHVVKKTIAAYIDKAQGLENNWTDNDDDLLDGGLLALAEADRNLFDCVCDTIWQMPAFWRLVGKPLIEEAVNQILDRPPNAPLFGYINRCRVSLPNDQRSILGWHQEIFQTVPDCRFVQIYAPLIVNSKEDTNLLEICKGSHAPPLPKPDWRENANGVCKITFDDNVADEFEKVTFSPNLGQAFFFDGRLLHRSCPNLSNSVRYAMVGLYHDVDDPNFQPPLAQFSYRDKTPKEYFQSLSGSIPGARSR
ncbi:MAG TPA: hypothetical protein DCS82_12085 [Rhodospirillaceae bacterium]|nr:hypothetical protein [Rhodospirillaceae bacterium]HAA91501.1 hypothetical protein [Rhodospirillaceae bacterium]HAT36449.1 hypothetical protein [Rhodospirillaceae bacterium]